VHTLVLGLSKTEDGVLRDIWFSLLSEYDTVLGYTCQCTSFVPVRQVRPLLCRSSQNSHTLNRTMRIYLRSKLTNDGRCTCDIKSRIAMAKAAFSKKKTLFTSKLDLNLRKKLIKCYIWIMSLYGAETWTLQAADQKYLESFEMWC